MKYIPLHVKTSYSLLTSLNDIKKMISFCKEKGIKSIAITDTNMYGVMEFYKECIKNDIKPIIGLEINLNSNVVLLYAKNYDGYQNLTRLIYLMQNKNIELDDLKKHNDNLICVSNKDAYNDLSKIYDDIYLGYTNISDKDSNLTNKAVYVNEILCMNKEDIPYLKYLYLIKENKKIENSDFLVHDNCYFDFLEDDYRNALELSNKCNVEFHQNKSLMPKYDVDDSKEYLFNLCKKGLYKRLDSKVTKGYYERLLYELSIINEMGFNDYFLVVFDYVKYAKKNNILVGPGRGSAAGSLVAYSLGITDVDPIKYDLLFERFLNPERITMPDIDIDFDSNYREQVVQYVINKYDKKRAVPIITFTTLSGKQVLRDICRIYDIKLDLVDKLTKFIGFNMSLDDALANIKLRSFLESNLNLKDIYKIALKLEGLKRQISVHAAGVIISACDLDSYIPLVKYDNYYISGYSMEHLEELGLIKMDFLALKNLTTIDTILKDIGSINFKDINLNDQNALKLFHDATTCGIFQFESSGMKNFLKKLKPNTFDDVVAAIALFRPGPADNIDSYIRRKNGLEKIDYLDKSLYEILKPTYGIIIYQEQIMQIANVMAGYSYGEADVLRRAMSKKKKEVMESEKDKFINRSIDRGYTKELSEKVYNFILKFANYGFNKAHSVAYSMIALKMAYLKYNYGAYFMAALLTNVIGSDTKTKEYIDECKKMNLNVLKPSINKSEYNYKSESSGIRFSLATIRNVGSITCKEIINERKNGEFTDFCNFVKRTYGKSVNKKTIESLIDTDCFSEFGFNHKTLYNNIDAVINYALLSKDLDESLIEKPIINESPEFDTDTLIEKELSAFGFYLSNHPVTKYKKMYDNIIDTNNIEKYFDKRISMVLYVDKIRTINTKNNDKMAFITASDEFDRTEIIAFPKEYDLLINISRGDIVLIYGKVEKRLSRYQVLLEKLSKL